MKGEYVFLDDKYQRVEYTDYNDIPEDVEFRHIIKFVCDYPPPPHNLEDHVLLANFNTLLKKFMKRVYGR
jgi:hypothetical protein